LSIAYNPAGPLYVTSTYGYDVSANSNFYYTSTDGSNWTKRLNPNPSIIYYMVEYTGGRFFALATQSITTNGVMVSTDGINWTSGTSIAMANVQEIVSNGSNNIVVAPWNSTAGMYSTDGGTTWASSAFAVSPGTAITQNQNGFGIMTWNAGAGLFICTTATIGVYQTSPTGQTWTSRAGQITYDLGGNASFPGPFTNQTKFASNATTTIAVGVGGFFATTTDGLTWSNHGFIKNGIINLGPSSCHYDGTRFVVRFGTRVFYSTNGTTWAEGKPLGSYGYYCQSGGVMFGIIGQQPILFGAKLIKMSDVTSTTKQTLHYPTGHNVVSGTVNHVRIK
jgi:hypothetical protein